MEWIETERGGQKLLLDGYVYIKKRKLADGWESYECELRRNRRECKAKIKVKVSGDSEFRERTEHNHPPDHGKANAYKLKASMKRMAVETELSPQQILMVTMHQATEEGLMAMPGLENIRRSIRRQRQDSRDSLAINRMVHIHNLESLEGQMPMQRSVATADGIRRQQQDSWEVVAMERMIQGQEVLEGGRPLSAGDGLIPQPGLGNIKRCIKTEQDDSQEVVATDRMVKEENIFEDCGSVPARDDHLAQLGLENIWSNIRRQQRNIREALALRRNYEDQRVLESH